MNSKNSIILLLVIICQIIILPGCWDRRELNELSIVSAVGIELAEQEEELTYIFQIINPSAITGKGIGGMKVPFVVESCEGKTIFEVSAKANTILPRELYYDHLQVFIISYNYAKEKGIAEILDGFYRNHEVRENILVLISYDSKTENVLSTLTTLENINGIYIKNILNNSYKNASTTKPIELREIVNTLSSETKSLVVPLIDVSETEDLSSISLAQSTNREATIKIAGLAVFKKDKVIGTLDHLETLALNCINDKLKKAICVVSYKGGNNSIELVNSKTKIKADFKNGQPQISIDVKHRANINEINVAIDLSDPKVIKDLEKEVDEKINMEIRKLIKKAQKELNLDIFGFGEALRRENPKEWEKIKTDWESYFVDLKVEIKVNTTIQEVEMKNKTFLKN
ncbi:MAG: Ger(x)C family spore germination protein [Vulcanibacillus sp.]